MKVLLAMFLAAPLMAQTITQTPSPVTGVAINPSQATAANQPFIHSTYLGTTAAGNGGYQALYFDTDANKVNINHSVSVSSDTFTIAVAGKYMATCTVQYNVSATAGAGRYAAIFTNGSAGVGDDSIVPTVGAGNATQPTKTIIRVLAIGDTLKCVSRADVAGLTVLSGSMDIIKLW